MTHTQRIGNPSLQVSTSISHGRPGRYPEGRGGTAMKQQEQAQIVLWVEVASFGEIVVPSNKTIH